ncbi:MAG: hypothetical protein WEC58_01385, partial [Candidatus Paceibacterota bacterium]
MEIGIENFIAFFRQAGLAAAGAGALWGCVFLFCARRSESEASQVIFHWIARRLELLMYGGIIVATSSWLALSFLYEAFAHEGITLYPSVEQTVAAFPITAPGYLLLVFLSCFGLIVQLIWPRVFNHISFGYFLALFATLLFLTGLSSAWTGDLSSEKGFFVIHGVHSIFTLGTVVVLDFLILTSKPHRIIQQHVFPLFPWISAVIWVGLGFDFLSVALVFDQAFMETSRFFFSQTVIGILIINGTLLSGPITRKILGSLELGFESIGRRWMTVAELAGVISITSWTAITFVDFFPEVPFSYPQLIGLYVL